MFKRGLNRPGRLRLVAVVGIWGVTAAAFTPGRENYADYLASASNLIASVNALAGDVERLDETAGALTPTQAEEITARLVKAREGFAAIITYDDRTEALNEGFILYIDKALLAVATAREYAAKGGPERLARINQLAREDSALRAKLNADMRRDKKKFGLD